MRRASIRTTLPPIALAVFFASSGSAVRLLLDVVFDVTISVAAATAVTFALGLFAVLFFYPRVLRQPFGERRLRMHLRRLGLFLPHGAWRHLALGVALAACTLSGMLIASILTGRYQPDVGTINWSHSFFSLGAGVWEEVFYRGILMAVLLRVTGSVRMAILVQVALFALGHAGGLAFWSLVDLASVAILALAFTYVALATRTLLAGMVFHTLHDALLFFVQLPSGGSQTAAEQATFYLALWLMAAVAVGLTWWASTRWGVRARNPLFRIEPSSEPAG